MLMHANIPRVLLEPLTESVSYTGAISRAVEQYMREPNDMTFEKLSDVTNESKQSLADAFYSILNKKPSQATYRHAAIAFWGERRLLEAAFFCEKFQSYDPTNLQAIRMSAMVAGSRGDLLTLESEITKLQEMGTANSALLMIYCLIHFIKNEYAAACYYAEQGLKIPPPDRDPFASRLAIDVSLRVSNAKLLSEALLINGDRIGEAQRKDAWHLLRGYLLTQLQRRRIAKECGDE